MSHLHVAVVDVGSPKQDNLGWAIGSSSSQILVGDDLCVFIETINNLLKDHPVALGFECPLFAPAGADWKTLTNARLGDGNRAWSAGAGATSMATGLVQASYVLRNLQSVKKILLDWQSLPANHGELLVFEAFVSGSGKSTNTKSKSGSHQEDSVHAVREFFKRIDRGLLQSDVTLESDCRCFSIIGAVVLHAGIIDDISMLHKECLVLKI